MRRPRQALVRLVCRPLVLAALATAALASQARAQNLLGNPEIVDLSAWTACGDGTSIHEADHAGCPDSGSIEVGAAPVDCGLGFTVPPYELTLGQCVPLAGTGLVAGSSKVFFSGWTLTDQNVTMGIALRYFTSDDCTGDEISNTLVGGSGYVGTWTFWAVLNPVTLPVGTASIEYEMVGLDLSSGGFFLGSFDDGYLGTRTRLFDEGFEHASSTPCHWSAYSP